MRCPSSSGSSMGLDISIDKYADEDKGAGLRVAARVHAGIHDTTRDHRTNRGRPAGQGIDLAGVGRRRDRPVVWTTAALLGQHPIPPEIGRVLVEKLGLDESATAVLSAVPYRGGLPTAVPTDPTVYRLYEVIQVYGPALKELIHEEFGDGIMSAINFSSTSSGCRTRPATVSSSPSTGNSCRTTGFRPSRKESVKNQAPRAFAPNLHYMRGPYFEADWRREALGPTCGSSPCSQRSPWFCSSSSHTVSTAPPTTG